MALSTLTLTDFLLARIAEDEAAANDASALSWRLGTWRAEHTVLDADGETYIAQCGHTSEAFRDGVHIARHDPKRVLRTCAAFDALVKSHDCRCAPDDDCVLTELAWVYADHEDFQEEWLP